MSIFDTILSSLRSLVGGGTTTESDASASNTAGSGGRVSVEHEGESDRESADASTEAAVKGTEPGGESEQDAAGGSGAAAAGTDAAASTETLVDEEAGKEPAEAVTPPGESDADESDESESEESAAAEADESTETEAQAADDDRSVEEIKGIGPAYAGRLEEFGIETVGELAAADAEDVADAIDVSESRVTDWIERARDE